MSIKPRIGNVVRVKNQDSKKAAKSEYEAVLLKKNGQVMRQCLTATQSFFSCTVSQRNTRQQTDQASPFSWYSSMPSSMLARIIGLVSRPPLSSNIRREIISPIFVNVSSALFSSCIDQSFPIVPFHRSCRASGIRSSHGR